LERGRVSRWRKRFAADRLDGLHALPRPGPTPRYTADTDKRILALFDQPPPAGYGRWTAPLLSRELVDVSDQYIWRFLRDNEIDLAARKSWCQTDDPDFVTKAAEIVGLYLDPPQDAIVLAVDEKPHIQALERAQGYLKLPNGRALCGHSHDYKRNGTSTLFAALEVATGQVTAAHYKRRRRVEFLGFMNRIVADYPGKEIHVILDHLSTHKPKRDRWLARHPNVRLHFTPTDSSWLNQIEVWFSILQGLASPTSVQQLKDHIDSFVDSDNTRAAPFVWTKSVVHQKCLKSRFSDSMIPGTRMPRIDSSWQRQRQRRARTEHVVAEGKLS
jgi:transposase